MPKTGVRNTRSATYDHDWLGPDEVVRDLDRLNGSRVEIDIEIELPSTGPLTTVGGVTLITPAMWCLLAAQAVYGSPILPYVSSSYRSRSQQAALYAAYLAGHGNLAAPPGSSNHETGTALDIETSVANRIVGPMNQFGWIRDVMPIEPWHFHWVGLN